MSAEATLASLALGEARPLEVRPVLRDLIKAPGADTWQKIYFALRSWTWKAINGRRRDPELRQWFDLLHLVAGAAARRDSTFAQRFIVLHEMVAESIAVAERRPIERLLERKHVVGILRVLLPHGHGWVERAELGASLGLEQANLTRIIALLDEAGLIERRTEGRQVLLRLTVAGMEGVRSVPDSGRVSPKDENPVAARTPPADPSRMRPEESARENAVQPRSEHTEKVDPSEDLSALQQHTRGILDDWARAHAQKWSLASAKEHEPAELLKVATNVHISSPLARAGGEPAPETMKRSTLRAKNRPPIEERIVA